MSYRRVSDQYAFKASEAFTNSVMKRWRQVRAYKAGYTDPLQKILDPHFPMYTHHILDVFLDEHFVGFADATDDVPVGLSRSQRRDSYLIPARGSRRRVAATWRRSTLAPRLPPCFGITRWTPPPWRPPRW